MKSFRLLATIINSTFSGETKVSHCFLAKDNFTGLVHSKIQSTSLSFANHKSPQQEINSGDIPAANS